ncbi:hypothetical protein ISCGN_003979 [Ixodes scapularis]
MLENCSKYVDMSNTLRPKRVLTATMLCDVSRTAARARLASPSLALTRKKKKKKKKKKHLVSAQVVLTVSEHRGSYASLDDVAEKMNPMHGSNTRRRTDDFSPGGTFTWRAPQQVLF